MPGPADNSNPPAGKALVAMSGGVDSSLAAALLKERGHEVVGCFMRLGSDDSVEVCEPGDPPPPARDAQPHRQGCCSIEDATDARAVAARLGIPFYVLNFKKDFGRIIDYFVAEYNAGRTPNPCVRCNDWLKFGKLAAYAASIEADWIATGHYARIDRPAGGGRTRLLRGCDRHKDQSYVLFGLPRPMLDRMILPIGEYTKDQVRQMARERALPIHDKPDSQEICFVPDNDYGRLVAERSPQRVGPGKVLDEQGQVIGEHPGHQHFTIGQRRGLNVAAGHPVYVVAKDPAANTVTVGEADRLLAAGLEADQANWHVDPPSQPRRCEVKIRSMSQPVPATVIATGDSTLRVTFDDPTAAVSAGQAVVCYLGDELIGGGWITRALGEMPHAECRMPK
jgi:tRNA-specific 2-thiouridylase